MDQYDHKKIEKKWQKHWEETNAFRADDVSSKEKNYLLIEFPYPSGDGLHVGHVRSWTALDVVARKHRAEGKNVLYPIGWDAFGLPAENFALKTGIHPKILTKKNTDNFKRQIKSIGLSFDWSREIDTTDPAYYKWTQWIFLQLFKKGLAYKAKAVINWCPKDKVGLANEEVVDGECERCGTPVEKREKEQWMLAITKYAQRLYDDLETVDYIERAKVQQRNWIGPSEGAEIDFAIAGSDKKIKVFTTRPDTLFGATYMVLAPEHALVGKVVEKLENKDEVLGYVAAAKNRTEIERSAEGKEKTGVELRGIKAINPANKEEIPIFVADYVLGGYGTGAIMAVPAHDDRDFAFAQKYNIPIKHTINPVYIRDDVASRTDFTPKHKIVSVVEDGKGNILTIQWGPEMGGTLFLGGTIEEGETPGQTALRELAEETGYTDAEIIEVGDEVFDYKYFASSKGVAYQAFTKFVHVKLHSLTQQEQKLEQNEVGKFKVEWVSAQQVPTKVTEVLHVYAFNKFILHKPYTGSGTLTNSGHFNEMNSEEAKQKITEFVGGKWVTTFKLRDWVFSRQRYWGEPIPMIFCEVCDKKGAGWQPVPENQLPVLLPDVEQYRPGENGESPLAGMPEWYNTTCPACSGPAKRETDVMPQWAGSSWYYLRYCDSQNDQVFADPQKLKHWTPVDWYNGGMEHTTLHLLYSRFWHKFLFDIGVVPSSEPYKKRTSHGLILAEDGSKMSKSKGNTVSPDELVEAFGADSLRLYEMFIGPFDQPTPWNSGSVVGVRRFLERVWKLAQEPLADEPASEALEVTLHHTIKKVGEDVETMKFNTAVSQLMICLNAMEKAGKLHASQWKIYLGLLAPFAPHVASELWEKLGFEGSISKENWPQYDLAKLVAKHVLVAVQINGKSRSTIQLAADASEAEALDTARKDSGAAKWLAGGREARAVYVPGKIINFVIER
ncbi:MAG: class I tRNA ligase family protein [bacterium]